MVEKSLVLSLAQPATCACTSPSSRRNIRSPNFARFHPHRHWSIHTATRTRCLKSDSNETNARSGRPNFSFERRRDDVPDDEENDDSRGGGGWKRRRRRGRRWSGERMDEIDDETSSGILDQVIESIWIFKVFKSFGYMLPFIILSLFITTGPKAFIASVGVAVAPSLLYLVLEKVIGKDKSKQKRRTKTGRRVSTETVNDREEEEERKMRSETRKRKVRSQSRVRSKTASDIHYNQGTQSFGGWDDLVEVVMVPPEKVNGSIQINMTGDLKPPENVNGTIQKDVTTGEKPRRERDMPLLLRLLVAVFPALGSWTEMLW